jgi:hypothetical protein
MIKRWKAAGWPWGLGCIRGSNGCHRKFRGHNFDSCVTNFDKISVFSLRSRYGKFRGFHRHFGIRTAVSNLQNPTHALMTQRGARRAARRGCGGLGPKMARQSEI